jgi:O-antigen/teichoic acid export membrane protein
VRGGLTILAALAIYPFRDAIYPLIVGESWPKISPLFGWFALSMLAAFVTPVFNQWAVIEEKPRLFAAFGAASTVLLAVIPPGAAVLTGNFRAVIVAEVLVGVLLAAAKCAVLAPHLVFRFNRGHLKEIAAMGWPILVRSSFNQLRGKLDKVYVATLYSGGSYAVYNWAQSLYRLYSTVDSHFSKVFEPPLYRQIDQGKVDFPYFRRLFFIWFYFLLAGCVLFNFTGRPLIRILTNDVFTNAYEPILLLTGMIVQGGLAVGWGVPIVARRQMKFILAITVLSALALLGGCLLLIPRLGVNGGILAMALSQSVTMVAYFLRKQSLLKAWFAEREVFAYAQAYQALMLVKVLGGWSVGPFLAVLLLACTLHLAYRERETVRRFLRPPVRKSGAPEAIPMEALRQPEGPSLGAKAPEKPPGGGSKPGF